MRRRTRHLLIFTLLLISLAILDRSGVFGHANNDHQRYHRRKCQVLRALDASVLELAIRDGDTHVTQVQLIGLDGVMTGKSLAAGHKFLNSLTVAQRVQLELEPGRTRDRAGKLMAYVYLKDDLLLNAHLIETGHALADPLHPHTRSREFQQLQKRAKRQGHGIWAAEHTP